MAAKSFLDTNVLVYAFGDEVTRKAQAADLIEAGGVVSVQVLNEFVNVARRKLKREWDAIRQALDTIRIVLDPPLPISVALHLDALTIAERYGFNVYDSLIISAAKQAGCSVLYTEDLQDGQVIEGVRVHNPFAMP